MKSENEGEAMRCSCCSCIPGASGGEPSHWPHSPSEAEPCNRDFQMNHERRIPVNHALGHMQHDKQGVKKLDLNLASNLSQPIVV
jgi:hypothetical protein